MIINSMSNSVFKLIRDAEDDIKILGTRSLFQVKNICISFGLAKIGLNQTKQFCKLNVLFFFFKTAK